MNKYEATFIYHTVGIFREAKFLWNHDPLHYINFLAG